VGESRRVAIVTGANTGIGRATAVELARRGFEVVLANRDETRSEGVVADIRRVTGATRVEVLPLDLGSLASVRRAAALFLASERPLHVLVNNAGVGGQRGLTSDGFELHFGVNHLGHFLFTNLLLDRIRASAPARVVTVSSNAHRFASRIDFGRLRHPTRSLTGYPEYQVSKLANVVFTVELARRLEGSGVSAFALDPGVIASDIWRGLPRPMRLVMTRFMRPVEVGARTSVHLASAAGVEGDSGGYFVDCRRRRPNPLAFDGDLARALWHTSARWTGVSSADDDGGRRSG
jgi:retinol dehydrogenase 12